MWLIEVEHRGILWWQQRVSHLPPCKAPKCARRAPKPWWLVTHRSGLLFGLSCQFGSQRRWSPYLLGHSVRLFLVPLLSPRVSSPCSSCSIPPLGTSRVADDLRPCDGADHEHLGALHNAGVDEDDFSCCRFAETEAFVDEPLVDDQSHDSGLVRESFLKVGFVLGIVDFILLLLHPTHSSDRHLRLHFS